MFDLSLPIVGAAEGLPASAAHAAPAEPAFASTADGTVAIDLLDVFHDLVNALADEVRALPLIDEPTVDGATVDGPTVDGTAVDGTAVVGTAVASADVPPQPAAGPPVDRTAFPFVNGWIPASGGKAFRAPTANANHSEVPVRSSSLPDDQSGPAQPPVLTFYFVPPAKHDIPPRATASAQPAIRFPREGDPVDVSAAAADLVADDVAAPAVATSVAGAMPNRNRPSARALEPADHGPVAAVQPGPIQLDPIQFDPIQRDPIQSDPIQFDPTVAPVHVPTTAPAAKVAIEPARAGMSMEVAQPAPALQSQRTSSSAPLSAVATPLLNPAPESPATSSVGRVRPRPIDIADGSPELERAATAARPPLPAAAPARPVSPRVLTPLPQGLPPVAQGLPLPAAPHAIAIPVSEPPAPAASTVTAAPAHLPLVVSSTPAVVMWPATASPMTSAAPETPAPHNLDQIVQSIRLVWARGVGEAQIRLEPERFGELTIAIRVEHGQVIARLQSDAPAVREWLQGNQATLRQGLADHHLTLDRLEVVAPEPPAEDSPARDSRERRAFDDTPPRRHRRPPPDHVFDIVA